jgi:hypothetical protein
MTVNTQNEVCKRFAHPNSIIWSNMLNSGLLGNKEKVSKICHLAILYANLVRVRLFRSFLMVVVL